VPSRAAEGEGENRKGSKGVLNAVIQNNSTTMRAKERPSGPSLAFLNVSAGFDDADTIKPTLVGKRWRTDRRIDTGIKGAEEGYPSSFHYAVKNA
jgi:hypothetical protein